MGSGVWVYIDHFKGNRKLQGKSKKNDFRPQQAEAMEIQSELDYWKNLGN